MSDLNRRSVLGLAAAATVGIAGARGATARPWAPVPVPYSAGTNRPFQVPHGAVDSHIHILEPDRFPYLNPVGAPPPATVADYRLLQARLGTQKCVVVTLSNHGTDNRNTLSAIAQFGQSVARGVAVVAPSITDAELAALHVGGIRGVRYNLTRSRGVGTELIRAMSRRIAPLGWHVQVHLSADDIVERIDDLRGLATDLVFDHMGRIPGEAGVAHPAFGLIRGLIDEGHTWVKVSGVYLDSASGPTGYADRSALAKAFVRHAPERMVWGTDWPHTTATRGEVPIPNDADMLNLLPTWTHDHGDVRRILVSNPNTLYGFSVR